jgi:hypothetical protein
MPTSNRDHLVRHLHDGYDIEDVSDFADLFFLKAIENG